MGLEYWPCYHSYFKKCEKLTDQELGRLFRALMLFSRTGEMQELAGRESIAFDFIADDIARAQEAYDAKCHRNSESAKSRYANASERIRTQKTQKKNCESCQSKDKDKDKTKDKTKSKDNISSDGGFDEFWALYPRKSGDIRQAAFEFMGVIDSGVPLKTILDAVSWQAETYGSQYMPSAEKWLKNRGWTEEKPKERKKSYTTAETYKPSGETMTAAQLEEMLDKI